MRTLLSPLLLALLLPAHAYSGEATYAGVRDSAFVPCCNIDPATLEARTGGDQWRVLPATHRVDQEIDAAKKRLYGGRVTAYPCCDDSVAPLGLSSGSFSGPAQTDPTQGTPPPFPYDAAIAVGDASYRDILAMVNTEIAVYAKDSHTLLMRKSFAEWAQGTAVYTDPKCFFDPSSGGHWVMAYLEGDQTSNDSWLIISASASNNPQGTWHVKRIDATLYGGSKQDLFMDRIGLGYDQDAVYVTGNMHRPSDAAFQYAKIRVLSKQELYSGADVLHWTDFVAMIDAQSGAGYSRTIAPALSLTSGSTEYLIDTEPLPDFIGSYVTMWTITGAPSAPVLTRQPAISVIGYHLPPSAEQKGSGTAVKTGGCEVANAVYYNGLLHCCYTDELNTRSVCAYLQITQAGAVAAQRYVYDSAGGHDYYYPAVTVDRIGNVIMCMNRSGYDEYISTYAAAMAASGTSFGAPVRTHAGSAPFTQVGIGSDADWGDYSGSANDNESNVSPTVWMMSGYAGGSGSGNWFTWIQPATYPLDTAVLGGGPAGGSGGQGAALSIRALSTVGEGLVITIPRTGRVDVRLYDARGRCVLGRERLLLQSGKNTVRWSAFGGGSLGPGAFLASVYAPGLGAATAKIILLRRVD